MAGKTKNHKTRSAVTTKLWLVISIITVFLSGAFFILGYTIANSKDSSIRDDKILSAHMHSKYEVTASEPKPIIKELELKKDAKSGWNLKINTENFEFTPEQVNQEHAPGKGHAHLYIDGVKITRIYSNNYYIADYNDGVHELTVTLNTNSHSDYYVDGKQVNYSLKMVGAHGHSDSTPEDHPH